MTMLHITNGDAAGDLLRTLAIGDVLCWRDVLHDGPVPAGLPLPELSAIRARFIAERLWGPEEEIARELAERDAALAGCGARDEVVLWFEHDLYDQLQLIQLLDWFAANGGPRLSLVCGAEYLGTSEPARLAERFGQRSPVSADQLALGAAAWAAFRSPDPTAIITLLEDDTVELPYLADALARHLEQFPSTANGLSRSEQQALQVMAGGAATLKEAYLASHHALEDPIWLGDASFFGYVEDLAGGEHSLVDLGPGERHDGSRTVALTDAGRAVLEGRQDRVRLNGIDRWLGGVHLHGREAAWRWDASARTLVPGG
ncbi:MAG TPA: DUF1835 domain-containing protein [Longimicrobium sp.]|nr:DUF1835 domain-containing protein [Longimicrobium sp.]